MLHNLLRDFADEILKFARILWSFFAFLYRVCDLEYIIDIEFIRFSAFKIQVLKDSIRFQTCNELFQGQFELLRSLEGLLIILSIMSRTLSEFHDTMFTPVSYRST